MKSHFTKSLVERLYSGKNAEQYEKNRSSSEKWRFEEETLFSILSSLPSDEVKTIADIPVGTNRYADRLEALEVVQRIYCVDFSIDMLTQALRKQRPKQVFLKQDLLHSPPRIACSTVMCLRFLNLFSFSDLAKIMNNIVAVLDFNLILSIRLADELYSHGDILEKKIHIHGRAEFTNLVNDLGLAIRKEAYYPDMKGGQYFMMHLIKKS
jgi:hypothetical protein